MAARVASLRGFAFTGTRRRILLPNAWRGTTNEQMVLARLPAEAGARGMMCAEELPAMLGLIWRSEFPLVS